MKLQAVLTPLIRPALKLSAQADPRAEAASLSHKLGGHPYAEKSDRWPECPTCKAALSFIGQFAMSNGPLLIFFYCHPCFPWGLPAEARGQWVVRHYSEFNLDSWVCIAPPKPDSEALSPCSFKTEAVSVLPDWEELDRFSEKAVQLCAKLNPDSPWEAYSEAVKALGCLDDYSSLLGGYPRYLQGAPKPELCTECQLPLEFLLQLDSEESAGLMWGDSGLIYLMACPQHPEQIRFELQCC